MGRAGTRLAPMEQGQKFRNESAVTAPQALTRRTHLELMPRMTQHALAWCVRPTVLVLCTRPQERLKTQDTTNDASSTAAGIAAPTNTPTKNTGWWQRRARRRRPASRQARRPASQQARGHRAPRTTAQASVGQMCPSLSGTNKSRPFTARKVAIYRAVGNAL